MRSRITLSSRPLAMVVALAFVTAAGTAIGQQDDNAPVAGRTMLGTSRMDVIAEGWRASKLSVWREACSSKGRRFPRMHDRPHGRRSMRSSG